MIDDFGHSSGPTFTKSELEPPLDGLWCDVLDLWLPAEAAVAGTRATERPSSRAPLPTMPRVDSSGEPLPCLMFGRMTSRSAGGHLQEICVRAEPTAMRWLHSRWSGTRRA